MPQTLWIKSPSSSLLTPGVATSSVAKTDSIGFLEGKAQALAVRQLYEDAGLRLNPASDLATHISAAIEVSDKWLLDQRHQIRMELLIRGIQMDRIATCLLAAKDSPKIRQYLRLLAKGSLNVFERRKSPAKNALWELETLALLTQRSIEAQLAEPDNLAQLDEMPLGIACKKPYSEENLEKVLSQGVAQIERSAAPGLIAMNLDDLWPPNQIRLASSYETLGNSLSQENLAFLGRHKRHFLKYASTGRILGIMAASGGIARVGDSYVSARQFTTWSLPSANPEEIKLINALQTRLQSGW